MQAPCDSSGTPLLSSITLPESVLRNALASFAATLLRDMVTAQASYMSDAQDWSAQSKVAFTELLDRQLQKHQPRAGAPC